MNIVGLWHITAMEMWDDAYFNMVGQAFIQMGGNRLGNFQFGLVSGQLDGEIEKVGDEKRFYFSWNGSDEMDPVSGSGWIKLVDQNTIEGKIKFHLGDSSLFLAKRVK